MADVDSHVIGRYRVDQHVGRGGFGDVYRAYDPLLDRPVAIKILHRPDPSLTQSESDALLRQSVAEARAASALNHPGIITIYDVGQHADQPFIVMEWVDGVTLRQELAGGAFPPDRVTQIGSQIAAALSRAHDAAIIHRDLKPENIMVRPDGVVKIFDFGLARRSVRESQGSISESPREVPRQVPLSSPQASVPATPSSDGSATRAGLAGTPAYMSPEQIVGGRLTPASDLFALGLVLFEMTTGRHPFPAGAAGGVEYQILNVEPPPPETLATLPSGWNQTILQLLSKDPARRPRSAAEILHILGQGVRSARTMSRSVARRTSRSVRMVGRTSDLEKLTSRWSDAREGRGGLVIVAGEPGIGKTTLVESFLARIEPEIDALIASGRCSERLGPGEAYLPFIEALAELSASPQGGLIRSIVRGKAPTWYLHLYPEAANDSSIMDVQRALLGAGQDRMRRELVDAIEEISRSYALCLLLEDVHWADEATAELMAYMAGRVSSLPVLAITTLRPVELHVGNAPLERILLDLQGRGEADWLDLPFLTGQDVAGYVDVQFEGHRFPPSFAGWVHRKTEGNPLFMADLLRYLMEKGCVQDRDGWRLISSLESLEQDIPTSGRAMIGRVMERLTNEEHRILSVAAVSGATFDSLIVAEAAERDPAEVEDLLDRISRVHRLVSPLDEMQFPDHGLTTRHKFVHVLYQHYLYDDLPPAQRAQLHVRIADRLETHHGTEPQRVAAQLAFHFEMGRLLDKAASYYLVAARGEMAKLAIPQAEAFCKKSMQLIERLPDEHQRRQRLDALDVRAQVSSAMGRFEEAVAHYQEMARSAEAMEDPAAEIGALSQLLFPLVYIKQNERIRQTAGRVLKLGRTGSFPAAVARGHLALGMLYGLEGDFERASDHLEQSRVEAEHLGDAALLCMPLSEQAGLFCWQGRYREAVETMARARELALQAGDSQYVISSYFFDGMSHANLGNLSDALVSLEEGLRISSANNEQFWRVRFPNTLGWLHQEAFDFSRAAELNRESIESCVSLEMWEPAANSYVNLGTVALALGDPEGAKHALEEAEAIVSRDDWLRWRYQQRLQLGWAEYYLDRGDCAKAHEYAERCVSVASQSSGGKHLVLAYRQLGSIALALESFDEAESWLGTASAELERTDALLAAWRLHVTWAELGRKTGTKARARSHEQKAAEILQLMASQAPDDLRRSILQSETLIRLTSG